MIKLVLADDHTLIREGLKALIYKESTIEIIGEARDFGELASILSLNNTNVALIDVNLPTSDLVEDIKSIKDEFASVKILILSPVFSEENIAQIFKAGVLGYIHQNSERDELIYAIHTVSKGNKFISSFITLKLLDRVENSLKRPGANFAVKSPTNRPPVDISSREREVLSLIAEGYTNSQIADQLFTSKRTIESHRKNLIDKTKTKNTASLICFAFANGILDK